MAHSYTIELTGTYSWRVLADIDNGIGGEISSDLPTVSTTKLSRSSLLAYIRHFKASSIPDLKAQLDDGLSLKLVAISPVTASPDPGFSHHLSLLLDLATCWEDKVTSEPGVEKFFVKAGDRFRLHQLQFDAPGISAVLPAKSSNVSPVNPVSFLCVVEAVKAEKSEEYAAGDSATPAQ